ncbi:MAG: ABC transporter permease [Pseudomonadota bacterium]|jgi:simple sugar transport system permease protein|uniref:Simple sugar transport system permease protein n=1 Tax=Actibacterium naphthalenivorans TaxID=1614693 RepID=A0A840CJ96_9RHOB|nr:MULTISPECIES: ABC transporter permease [Actibacterium]ALG91423.1 ABC transporter permease [Actibacterium sp. EMB200-NS6]KGB82661.1 ABC transporter permease [Rhodovulum sp. NI22]MBB4022846.1 simple sugar transport system permease protein [Actibacterium naphthalenivorans]MDY6859256.1 ABC transporter permease [Pseudomonadota bacterium]
MTLFTDTFLIALLAGVVAAGVPLLLAGLGEQLSEKAGVLNVGIEGMMLGGAYAGFLVAWATESIGLGFLAGAFGGLLVAALMVLFCVRLGLNQVVIGIALTLGAEGTTALLHHVQFSRLYPRLPEVPTWRIPGLADIPIVGPALFDREPVVYLALALVPLFAWLYRRTHLGLAIQAAGDKPAALDSAGENVLAIRALAVLGCGALVGLGGAFMSIAGAGVFVPFMTHGNGFIGIVLAMLARGRPLWVLLGAALFGACLSGSTALQVAGVDIPTDVVQMLPFAAVMLVLLIAGRNAKLPSALGAAYVRGER